MASVQGGYRQRPRRVKCWQQVAARQTVTETKRLKFRPLLQRDNLMTEDQSRADIL